MRRILAMALVAASLVLPANGVRAAEKPLIYDVTTGQPQQLPSATALQLRAATTANPTINEPQGTSPSSPANGDRWTTSSGFFGRAGGITYGPFNNGTVLSVTCGGPLSGGTITTTGTCSISANALALSYLAQIGGSSYLGNQSTSSGNVTAYVWPTCVNDGAHALVSLPSSSPPIQCPAITAAAGGANPFFIGVPDIKSGCGVPSISADPVGSLYMDSCTARLYQQIIASGTVPAVVQSKAYATTNSVTLGATPSSGDLLIANCSNSGGSTPTPGSGWTSSGLGSAGKLLVYKTAVFGESTTQAPCASAGGGDGGSIVEVSGVTSWLDSFDATVATSNSTTLSTSTGFANELAIGFFWKALSASADPGPFTTSGLSSAISSANGVAGSIGVATATASQQFPSSSSSVLTTFTTPNGSSSATQGRLILLKPATAGWRQISWLTTIKNAGTAIELSPQSLDCSTGTACTTDTLGHVTLTAPAGGSSGQILFNNGGVQGGFTLGGDCSISSGNITCTKSSGALLTSTFLQIANNLSDLGSASTARTNLGLGTFATANAATPPAIGGTTPSTGKFTTVTSTNIAGGGVQCVQADNAGLLSGTGAVCGSGGGGGGVSAVTCGVTTITTTGTCVDVSTSTVADTYVSAGSGSNPSFKSLPHEGSIQKPAMASFTWVNQGAGSTGTDYGAGIQLHVPSTQTGFAALVKTAPATPYSVFMRFKLNPRMQQFTSGGVLLRNSTSGRLLAVTCSSRGNEGVVTANNVWQLAVMFERFSSATTFNANTAVTPGSHWTCPQWLRVDVTSTTATVAFSEDGLGWDYNVVSGTSETLSTYLNASGGTLDQIGFGLQASFTNADMFVQSFGTTAPN